jgi:hypothetical protein
MTTIFINNKYTALYYSIIRSSSGHAKKTYTESHHIIPKSLNGDDTCNNLVQLTAREHFICHWLLTKMVNGENKKKMIFALKMLNANNQNQQRYKTKITSRVYAKLKITYVDMLKGVPRSQEVKDKISATKKLNPSYHNLGKKFSDESKKKMSESHKGRLHSAATRQKMAESHIGKKLSEETRQKLCKPKSKKARMNMRKPKSEEHKKAIALAKALKKRLK